ncbi:GAK8 protein, partial [Rhagologus leucostigma]|nr:GAK8 protein [Rhagologus leucostigma]
MDRQAAYELFKLFLKKRQVKGIDLDKDLHPLLDYAVSQGFFINPHTIHELGEWRRFGDKLWELVLEDDKPAKKMSKLWKVVQNEVLMVQAEKRAAEGVRVAQERNRDYATPSPTGSSAPNPPAFSVVQLPAAVPSAPLLPEVGETAHERGNPAPSQSPTPSPCPLGSEPVPGAEPDLAGALARERRDLWASIARHGMEGGDSDLVAAATANMDSLAFPVVYTPNPQGGLQAAISTLDWKVRAQLRATVGSFGVTSEPAKQMLDYLFNAHLLLPTDIRGLARLIYTPHQRLLFDAHWQEEALASVNTQRAQGDPLHGITLDELMGFGPYARIEAQVLSGPDRCREIMAVAKRAMDKIKTPGGTPAYMGIKQGREEPLGTFVDKLMEAITRARVPEYLHGSLLKQCVLQNGNSTTRTLITSMPGDWNIPALLEKAASIPQGSQAFLVEALQKIGEGLQEQARALQRQAETSQSQVMAALAPLQAAAAAG